MKVLNKFNYVEENNYAYQRWRWDLPVTYCATDTDTFSVEVGKWPVFPGYRRALAVANHNLTDPFDLGLKSNGSTAGSGIQSYEGGSDHYK